MSTTVEWSNILFPVPAKDLNIDGLGSDEKPRIFDMQDMLYWGFRIEKFCNSIGTTGRPVLELRTEV